MGLHLPDAYLKYLQDKNPITYGVIKSHAEMGLLETGCKISRVIEREKRFEVLKRQKWRCNICGEQLKWNKHSGWNGKTAHIDHIFPYSKREEYPNGIQNINELENLQGLCPSCNLKKKNQIK